VRKAAIVVAVAAALWLAPGALAAGWCGGVTEAAADRPDVVTGQQVHTVVAVPADAADTFATRAGQLADDVTSMLTWWQGQDPTRVPRFDQATFGAANCLDVSFVRLPGPAATYTGAGASAEFQRVAAEVGAAGDGSQYKKYLVYFDGPSVQTGVCGTGGGEFSTGDSYAIVWLAGCPGVPTDSIAAHELLHALGALPAGAPHPCLPTQGGDGHPCDSTQDVLYPFTTGAPLAAQLLDVNHDDYYGHSGTWLDIQDSLWLHRLDLPQVALGIGFSGGAGEVSSDVPGVDCRIACTTEWDQGSELSLLAVPAATARLVRWTGACSGTGECSLALDQAKSATAVFGPLRIPVRVSTTGKGQVTCTPRCTKSFAAGEQLTLRVLPARGWRFKAWSGGCKGTRLICRPATDYALAVRATFRRR
jgi:hypothetical protein